MAIYRGKGGATQVEPAPGDTEFAGSIIVSGDILDKGNLLVEEDLLANGTVTSEGGFIGDGSGITNLPSVWSQDDGKVTKFEGDGSDDTQLWIVNGDKYSRVVQSGDGNSYFNGDGNTYFGTRTGDLVNLQIGNSSILAVGKDSVYSAVPLTATQFIGDGSQLTGLPPSGIPEAPVDGLQYGRQSAEWTQIEGDGVWSVSELTGDAVYDGNIDVQSVESNNDITVGPYKLNPAYGMRIGHGSGGALDYLGNPVPISSNVAIGYDTLAGGNQTKNYGVNITAIGTNALKFNEGGKNNTAVGFKSLEGNIGGQNNTAIGMGSAQGNVTGYSNTSVGSTSLLSNTEGTENTAIGHESLYQNTGAKNTALGTKAGNGIQSGSNNTVLGFDAEASSSSVSNEVTLGNADVTKVRVGNGDVIYPAPAPDSYTKTESDAINNAQDVKIQNNANAIATLPSADDFYTKGEIDLQQGAQDNLIITNNDEIARQQIEITNNSDNITKNDTAINKNILDISSNTTAIGTLSGQVGQNTEDIAELQNSIFFTSAYSAEYPSAPNRDPEDGNMYLQNVALFTYSFAAATQIFVSKTDESGNVRQFTAVQPGDSIVLNEVNSPNYGRYELVTIEEVSDSYVVMNVIPKLGQGTVITGAKIAFQAFPKVGLWDENESNGYGTYPSNIEINGGVDIGSAANGKLSNTMLGRNASGQNAGASAINNVSVGDNAFAKMSGAKDSVAVGSQAMKSMVSGSNNTAIGSRALSLNPDGKSNVAIGAFAGATLAGGDNNILIGDNAAPSAPTVSNEITLGNDDTTVLRMGNGDIVYPASGGGGGYTPEPMVWEDVVSERAFDTVYTNTNDVPLYVQFYSNNTAPTYTQMYIDGNIFGAIGNNADVSYSTNLFIVPAGSTYELRLAGGTLSGISVWNEARMPVAVGTGGGDVQPAVVMQGTISSGSYGVTPNVWVPITIDSTEYDTNDCLDTATGRYIPNVEGYYLVNSATSVMGTDLTRAINAISLNGTRVAQGSFEYDAVTAMDTIDSRGTTIVYCNGTTDYISMELLANGTAITLKKNTGTQFSVSLITGQSSGGGTTDILPVLYSGIVNSDGGIDSGTGFTVERKEEGLYELTFDSNVRYASKVATTITPNRTVAMYIPSGSEDTGYTKVMVRIQGVNGGASSEAPNVDGWFSFALTGTETIAVGGSEDSLWTEVDGKAIYLNDVGIGTSTPTFESGTGLEIKNASTLGGHLKLTDSASTAGGTGGFDLYSYNTNGYIENYEGGTAETIFRNNGDQSMSINSSNQVEIEKDLTVNGITVGRGSGDDKSTAVGNLALTSDTTGEANTAVGRSALFANTEGSYNSAVGVTALANNLSGDNNTAIGFASGNDLTSGTNNTFVGYNAQPSAPSVSNEVNIGNTDVVLTRLNGKVVCNDNTQDFSEMQAVKESNYVVTRAWNDATNKTEMIASNNLDVTVGGGDLRFITGGDYSMTISADGKVNVDKNLTCSNLTMSGFPTTGSDPVYAPNMYIGDDGNVYKSGAVITYMTKEEVNEQLAVKDKLIEKLSARLDSLELKFKALK